MSMSSFAENSSRCYSIRALCADTLLRSCMVTAIILFSRRKRKYWALKDERISGRSKRFKLMRDAQEIKTRYQICEMATTSEASPSPIQKCKRSFGNLHAPIEPDPLLYSIELFTAVNGTNYSLRLRNVSDFYSKPKGVYRTTMRCTQCATCRWLEIAVVNALRKRREFLFFVGEIHRHRKINQSNVVQFRYVCEKVWMRKTWIRIEITRIYWTAQGFWLFVVVLFFTRSINLLSRFIYWFCNALCMTKVHIYILQALGQ